MEDPELYVKIPNMPRRDANDVLELIPIKWKESNARVLDIGCGDGNVTTDILKKHIPKNFMKLVGCDINQISVDFAQERYGSEKIQFMTLDIQGKIPDELKEGFDHIFSCYVFHWVEKQVTAFTNVYNMLAEGGNCLIIFLERTTVYEVYEKLSRMPKWSAELKDIRTQFVSPYHDSQDPLGEISSMMKSIGFKDVDVKALPKTYSYENVDEFKMLMKCLNRIESLKSKWDDFIKDCVSLGFALETVNYRLIVAYGSK